MKKTTIIVLLAGIFGCTAPADKKGNAENIPMQFEPIEFPGENASLPNLTSGPDGKIYLSWVEQTEGKSTLNYATLSDNKWMHAAEITSGDNWFVNWADFPSLLALEKGYTAHFLAYITEEKYSYGVNLSSSSTGNNWNEPMLAHDDNTPTEHGFVTLLPLSAETYMAVWLDGRKYAETEEHAATKEMSLRSGIFDLAGNKLDEDLIDPRTCDCCQTDGAISSRGPVVVYRDRGLMEIRDIYISRYENGAWIEPWIVYGDGWEIPGCPVNGPAIDAFENQLSVAWFTASGGTPKVYVAFSGNDGDQFGEPVQIDLGNPLGRVDLKQFTDYSVVTWMEEKEETAFIYCRKVFRDGSLGNPVLINETERSRSSGFPRMAKIEQDLIFAWTVPGKPSSVKTVRGTFND